MATVVTRMSQLRDEQDEHDKFGAAGSSAMSPSFEQVEHAFRQLELRVEQVGTRRAHRALARARAAVEAVRFRQQTSLLREVYNIIAHLGTALYPERGLSGYGDSVEEALETARRENRAKLGLAGAGDVMTALSGNLVTKAVQKVTLRTSITPEMTYTPGVNPGDPAKVEGSTFGKVAMEFLKPELEIQTPAGAVRMAPNGRPLFNYFPLVAGAVILVGGAAAYFIARGVWDALGFGKGRR